MVFGTHLKSMLPKKNLAENKRASSLKRFDHFLCVCKGLGTGCVHTLSSHGQKLSGNQESAPFVLGLHEISDCTEKLLTQIHCKLLLFISKITICKMLAVAT